MKKRIPSLSGLKAKLRGDSLSKKEADAPPTYAQSARGPTRGNEVATAQADGHPGTAKPPKFTLTGLKNNIKDKMSIRRPSGAGAGSA